jgi:putative ATPase
MDLFEHSRQDQIQREAPLAARMRPRTLEEFVGQEHIVGEGRLLRRAIQADQLSSLIFWGPAGTGKTTLASIIANTTESHFAALSAVLAGVADLREVIAEAKERRNLYGRRTILLIDEIHRWNKAQQDAMLPHVEDGTVILIGATTENPYFSVIAPLVSRSRIFQLEPLSQANLRVILQRALDDPERGYGRRKAEVTDEAMAHIVNMAGGDARNALNALELAIETTLPDDDGVIHIDLAVAEESIQRRALRYDRGGDEHYDTISAFIKSIRGSDPDAALYWLAKMIYAGEDPRFIARRLVVHASEDVGLADPMALVVATAAAHAVEYVGMPEARLNLAEATLYLATAPKSNSVLAIAKALEDVEREGEIEVPDHLKDASRDAKGLGHGQGYRYPHNFPGHHVAQQYLPAALQGRRWYKPGDQGYEQEIAERLAKWRVVQRQVSREDSSEIRD